MLVSLFKDFDVPCPFDLGRIGDFQLVNSEDPHERSLLPIQCGGMFFQIFFYLQDILLGR